MANIRTSANLNSVRLVTLWPIIYPPPATKGHKLRNKTDRRPDAPENTPTKLEHVWFHAYSELRMENEGLVRSYEKKWFKVLASPEDRKRVESGQLQELLEEIVPEQAGKHGGVVKKIVSTILDNKDPVSQAVAGRPYAQLAWGGVLALLMATTRVFKEPQHALEGLEVMTDILVRHNTEQINFKSLYEPTSSEESLIRNTVKLYSRVLEYQIRLAEQCYSHRAIATIRNVFQVDNWGDMTKKLQGLDKRIIDELKTQKEAREQIERRLQEMHPVTRATWARVKEKSIFHEGTRRETRDAIHKWSEDPEGKPILWLSGLPGTGKSTVLRTIAAELSPRDSNSPRLGASFFFNKDDPVGSNIRNLFPTLACDLVETVPGFGAAVSQAIGSKSNIQDRSVEDQWRYFIQDPLLTLKGIFSSQIIVIIDAIDEIVIEDGIVGHLLQRLSETERLRFLISCRSESPARFQGLEAMVQERELGKIDVNNTDDNDITCVLTHQLAQISAKFPDLPPDVLGQDTAKELALQTDGFFFCLYAEILDRVLTIESEDDEGVSPLFQKVVGAMAVLRQPLSFPSLGKLISASDDDSDYIIAKIRSVIDVSEPECPPAFIHFSFKDYVLDDSRCPNHLFHITKERQHAELFCGCMKVMRETLHGDVRKLHNHSSTIDAGSCREQLPQHVSYACIFWVEHLSLSGLLLKQESHGVEEFLNRHFMHWLEHMAWLKMIPEADGALADLYKMGISGSLKGFVENALGLLREFKTSNDEFPSEIYTAQNNHASATRLNMISSEECDSSVLDI
ncbi:hypothetical protein BO78DRAFT_452879 [Aspergillus sclerotiicarbonarius CBS 121057]|uniref:NACHT domain-containing protein n=1 Tax=Aspergillus sclerotiicarbonarius (strain CBS 121057 / IBT 28362) TaxID=1448318 RepID=A0A319DYD7_ASPSB|nr:hypothetical protein BO78DRAFT_452879 [Aspergillus sclerotiicarbonarius CBS 121057]